MAKGGDNKQYTEDWFLSRGYSKNSDGSFSPPPFKNPLTTPKPNIDVIIPKQKVVETKNFEVKPVTEWFIPYQVPSKKNSRQNFVTKSGKQISIPSKRHKDYITATKKYWQVFGVEFNQTMRRLNLTWPVDIEMTFIRSTRQRFDYCNVSQTIEDLMVDFGWIPDDSANFMKPIFANYKIDKNNPGVTVRLITK